MRELGLAKETVRRFARATKVEDLLGTARAGRPSVLDEYEPYLHHRFNLGHTNGSTLFALIDGLGPARKPLLYCHPPDWSSASSIPLRSGAVLC